LNAPELDKIPRIERLHLGQVHLPAWHPRHSDKTAQIFAFAVDHPDGVVLFDCGCAHDSELINRLYSPEVVSLESALGGVGIRLPDIRAVVLSHLHFDHVGQLRAVRGRPTFIQRAEIEAARSERYTIAEWAHVPGVDLRALDGDTKIGRGLEIFATPGHTPGHQSLVVRGGGDATILGGQCCYEASAFETGRVEADNLHSDAWGGAAHDSIERLRRLRPSRMLLSHDPQDWERRE
jgi:N-acyl homoserine lactone hydrolase